MLYINRAKVKAEARAKVFDKSTGLIPLTAAYLLFGSWISGILQMFVESPTTTVSSAFYEVASDIADKAIAAGIASPDLSPAYAAAIRVARELLALPGKQAVLFGFLLLALFEQVVGFGYRASCLRIHKGEAQSWKNLFDLFWLAGSIILMNVVVYFLSGLGLIIAVIPGLFFYYALRFAPYILMEHPEWGALRSMAESWSLTRGHKMRLFVLDLSFIVWDVGVSLNSEVGRGIGAVIHPSLAGVGSLAFYTLVCCFYLPYKEMTLIKFYQIIGREKSQSLSDEHIDAE